MQQTIFRHSAPLSEDMAQIAHPGQHNTNFRSGYEHWLNSMPLVNTPYNKWAVSRATWNMDRLSRTLQNEPWVPGADPGYAKMTRSIIAMEQPSIGEYGLRTGAEIVVGHMGQNYSIQVHQHPTGFNYEAMIYGSVLETTYRLVDPVSLAIRQTGITHFKAGDVMEAGYRPEDEGPRIHSVRALVPSASLHFWPDREAIAPADYKYRVEYFEDVHALNFKDVRPVETREIVEKKENAVYLVRSIGTPFGDHFLKTGTDKFIQAVIPVSVRASRLLNFYKDHEPILLELTPSATKAFNFFHGFHNDPVSID